MKRITGIIVAGALTGTVLVTVIALGIRNVARAENTDATSPPPPLPTSELIVIEEVIPVTPSGPDTQAQVDDLVQTMAEREAAYQAQLEAANETIRQLEAERQPIVPPPIIITEQPQFTASSGGGGGGGGGGGEREDHDDDHEEHEEHEDDDD